MIFQYKDLSIETDDNVYEPSDDSYLLISALEKIVLKKGSSYGNRLLIIKNGTIVKMVIHVTGNKTVLKEICVF